MFSQILTYAIEKGASDIHLRSKETPIFRIKGELQKMPAAPELNPADAAKIIQSMMSDKQKATFAQELELDFALQFGTHRFRVNAFNTIHGIGAVLRFIPEEIKSMSALQMPQSIRDLVKVKQGLILVTGPTGSGKSTSLAAMIHEININYGYNIITIEDPIEFIHKSQKSLISQRQVGENTLSYSNALRSALREDPDVILVGEMRDLETIQLALTAAETGHLVFATLHTNSATQTIHRIIDVFPGDSKGAIRSMLSSSLCAIISQRLVSTKEGGRCAAFEILLSNPSVRNLIREDKVMQIQSIMELNKKQGMLTLKDSITDLSQKGIISPETAEMLYRSCE